DVDDDVPENPGRAAQPAPFGKAAPIRVASFDIAEGGQVGDPRDDAQLGKLAFAHLHLAAAADATAAANGIDVDAERARRLENRCSDRKPAAPPGRHEDDEGIAILGVSIQFERSSLQATAGAWRCGDGLPRSIPHPSASLRPAAAGFGGAGQARRRRPSRRRAPVASPSADGSRNFWIQRTQFGSWPIATSAPMIAVISSACSGLVIAEVMPAPISMERKAALRPCRFGSPKLKFEAPQVVLTFSSSRSRRTR